MTRTEGPSKRFDALTASSFPLFALLYLALFGAFGTESPFFPSFLVARGLSARELGLVLTAGTVVRFSTGPLLGMAADLLGARRVLAVTAFGAGTIILLYLMRTGFWALLAVTMVHAVVVAPLNPLADALALAASERHGLFPYGWVRGLGSAGFIAGTLASGVLVARFGIDSIIVAAAVLFALMVVPVPWLPDTTRANSTAARGGVMTLLAFPPFRRLLLVAGLVIGSHAMNETFGVIQWRAAGIGATTIGVLWSEAVGSEIVVFMVLGPLLLARLGAARCAALAAAAGIARWAVLSQTTDIVALIATQLLHGLTFSLMHLSCMKVIAAIVPARLSGAAQTLYGTLSLGIASAVLTLLSGEFYSAFGRQAFWLMAGLCLIALPLAFKLDAPRSDDLPGARRDESAEAGHGGRGHHLQ